MITVKVYFDFDTKDEWIEFGKKFYSIKEFEPYIPHFDVVREFKTIDELVEELNFCSCSYKFTSIETKSKKILKLVNEFIKENHYEKNYQLRDKWSDKLYMSLDELLKRV